MGFQMTDRKKFQVFDMEARTRHTIEVSTKSAEQHRETAAIATDGHMDMGSTVERMGRAIQVSRFKETISRLNPNIIFELSKGDPTKYGVYIRGLIPDSSGRLVSGLRFICGMESGINIGGCVDRGLMPEFSILEAEDVVIPDHDTIKKVKKFQREIRGWRTVLAALYLERLITEAQIEQTFRISEGANSANWQKRVNKPIIIGGQ